MDSKSKAELPGGAPLSRTRRARWPVVAVTVAFTALIHFLLTSPTSRQLCGMGQHFQVPEMCLQTNALVPGKNGALWSELTALHSTSEFLARAVSQLSAAVRIPTETFDEMGPVGEDERWLSRGPFIEHLSRAFPLVHATLGLQKVNTYGLIYTWQGTDATLAPILLMGHYDVVPVTPLTADQWSHPPYSGHFDGKNIWGRGSNDDKSGVIGILMAVEVLLEKSFKPTRTVVLSFGFDEEAGGYHGARPLSLALLKRFGRKSFAMIVDEGPGLSRDYGAIFAGIGVAEKGHVNVEIEVQTPGGHSSVPPAHTSIGILAALIVHLEANAPQPVLALGTPAFAMAQCYAAHAPALPHALKQAILRAGKSNKALKAAERLLSEEPIFNALIKTTQAVDIVNGGVRSNALPEQALAVVNHRIATQSSVNATLTRVADLLADLAARLNLSVTAYGAPLAPPAAVAAAYHGSLALGAQQLLEPAPLTPTDAPPFRLLAGPIRAVIRAARKDEEEVFVAPGLVSGNTDTRWDCELSDRILRYGHNDRIGGFHNVHTVDEHVSAESFVEIITFFTTLILNAAEAVLGCGAVVVPGRNFVFMSFFSPYSCLQ